ncbi:28S ribosomal protein S18b, mitochondrial [Sitodiplosis mosellana]|uniref:28S ribosomal protein S18b, mitochondrial n=1 Tax=Sitodiplosis mosellana TaxID=263140 RepID=UPI00244515EB|nr:28S ribosomal protein S18b, mitochondrial [Sitodiplosis mosellana]
MLRLAIAKNCNFFSKTLATNVDQTIAVNRFANYLKKTSNVTSHRPFSLTTARFCEANEEKEGEEEGDENVHKLYKKYAGTPRDRSKIIPVETSIEYLKSAAFQSTYGDKKVWELYRRVHKGQLPKSKTRKTCIRGNVIATGSPCPICRDEFLVLDYRNLQLLKMFISPHTGDVLSYQQTGLCQKQHTRLLVNIERAYDLGLLEYEVPHREFDYADYYDVYKKPTFQPK